MNNTDIKAIRDYLSGPRDYNQGVQLYQVYGHNLRLKHQFRLDDSTPTRAILINELRKLAGLSDAEFKALPRKAALSNPASGLKVIDEAPEAVADPAPETTKKFIRFRERFPFLNAPDCPDCLKILVADLFTAHNRFVEAHERLALMNDQDSVEAFNLSRDVVENYLENQEIWEELEYYREHGRVLGKAAKFRDMEEQEDLAAIPDVELVSQIQSAKVQKSKQRKKCADAKTDESREKASAQLEYWTEREIQLKAELDRRKKK